MCLDVSSHGSVLHWVWCAAFPLTFYEVWSLFTIALVVLDQVMSYGTTMIVKCVVTHPVRSLPTTGAYFLRREVRTIICDGTRRCGRGRSGVEHYQYRAYNDMTQKSYNSREEDSSGLGGSGKRNEEGWWPKEFQSSRSNTFLSEENLSNTW